MFGSDGWLYTTTCSRRENPASHCFLVGSTRFARNFAAFLFFSFASSSIFLILSFPLLLEIAIKIRMWNYDCTRKGGQNQPDRERPKANRGEFTSPEIWSLNTAQLFSLCVYSLVGETLTLPSKYSSISFNMFIATDKKITFLISGSGYIVYILYAHAAYYCLVYTSTTLFLHLPVLSFFFLAVRVTLGKERKRESLVAKRNKRLSDISQQSIYTHFRLKLDNPSICISRKNGWTFPN